QSGGQSTIVVQGLEPESIASSNAWKHVFEEPGDYTVQGFWTNSGQSAQGEALIHVVAAAFDTRPAVWIGRPRIWSEPSLPSEAVLDFDRLSALRLTEIRPVPVTGRAFLLDPVQTGDELLLARLGPTGPVLAKTTVECFDLLSTERTTYEAFYMLPDGSTVIITPISADDLPDGATIQLTIFIAGVTFDDGSIEKWITKEDLDADGFYYARIIHPPDSTRTGCHTLKIWLDGELIGRR
ncbi:MAG: hypothetical protein U1E27_11705, partial [Kiritimatiellia bacterium]|nr:hypothetical protein [Kiritimatiellia bacterium]